MVALQAMSESTPGRWVARTSLCAGITDAGFLIERLVEPLPDEAMNDAETLV
jgi:hypothetical protein